MARQRPWLDFATLAWVSISGIFWLTLGGPAWQAVLIGLIAIGFSASAGRLPFRRTPFDLFLLLFSLTALLGVWAAYNRSAAWDKFWFLTLSVLIYYALASQPRQNGWLISGLISLWGVLVSLIFLLVNDWQAVPADFRIIARIGQAWMAIRPVLPGEAPMPNITAGILAGFFPFTLAFGLTAWRGRAAFRYPWLLMGGAILSGGVLALTIFLTSSRGAWLALTAGLGFWLAWQAGDRLLQSQAEGRRRVVILGGCAAGVLALGMVVALSDSLGSLLAIVPGLPTGESRLGIDRLTLPLIGDFPFTGGGLGAFAGLFSQYMLAIPHVLFTYSHNLYLDVALEQGLAGLALLLGVYLVSAVLLFRSSKAEIEPFPNQALRQAALISLLVTGLHGLVDDPIYGMQGTPFLWVLPGIAAFSHPTARYIRELLPARGWSFSGHRLNPMWLASGLLLMIVAGMWILGPKRLAAAWMANRGAVLMAQMELDRFPSNEWTASQDISQLAQAQNWLEQAIRLDPTNRTANHRLGLIAMQRRDFLKATGYLRAALQQDASHRGVIKNLGYAYTWAGEYEQAQLLLRQIPEADNELGQYAWWWKTLGRADLAQNATQMRTRLAGDTSLRGRPSIALTQSQNSLTSIR